MTAPSRSEVYTGMGSKPDVVTHRYVTELEPPDADGRAQIISHWRNDTQREAERLYSLDRITHDQLRAANLIRDDWHNSGALRQLKAGSWSAAVDNSIASDSIIRSAAYEEYRLAMNQLSRDQRRVIEDVVIRDVNLDLWARRWRCLGDGLLTTALDRLAVHYERSGR